MTTKVTILNHGPKSIKVDLGVSIFEIEAHRHAEVWVTDGQSIKIDEEDASGNLVGGPDPGGGPG